MASKFELYEDRAGKYRFRLKLGNGQIVLASQSFEQRESAENAIASVKKNASNYNQYERKQTSSGGFMFNLKASNGQVIGTSESYHSASARDKGIEAIMRSVGDASVENLSRRVESSSQQSESSLEEKDTGLGLHIRREAKEIVLNGKEFAFALSRLFKNSEGEFSFALLGRWGSGKTSIANLVHDFLLDTTAYQAEYQRLFDTEKGEKPHQITYDAVKFNAWRYRQKPELWVYLYEGFLTRLLDCSPACRVIRTIRVGIYKRGIWQTLLALAGLAIAAVPLMWISLLFPHAAAAFGVMGVVGLLLLAKSWHGSLRRLFDEYGVVSSHREHLGMQSVIGRDLQALVKSWAKIHRFQRWEKIILILTSLAIGLLWFLSFWAIDYTESGTLSIQVSNMFSITSLVALIVWSIIAMTFVAAMTTNFDRVDRILLTVDDLDRCPQEEIVDLIDGIKLMIDDESIGNVVQALILADDTILDAAIRSRIRENASNGDLRWSEAVHEHKEKVLLCHAHMPKLSEQNVLDLVSVYCGEFAEQAEDSELAFEGLEIEAQQTSDTDDLPSVVLARPTADTVITTQEQNAIKSALSAAYESSPAAMTPRSVRSFMYKYQLARMLIQLDNGIYSSGELAHELADEVKKTRSTDQSLEARNESKLTKYVRLVA